jgi:hypothetical protein
MEGLLVLIAGYILLSPLVLIGVVIAHRKRLNRLEEELHHYSKLVERQLQQPAQRVPEAAQRAPDAEPAAEDAVQPIEPAAQPVQAPAPPIEPEEPTKTQPIIPATVFSREDSIHSEERVMPGPAAPAEPEEPEIGPIGRLRDFLRGIGMWPPESVAGLDREAVLMQWWLPRVGGLLALLSALFFGVYINQSTSPFIRCIELAATAVGISALGWYLERKFRTFGGVLVVTGLVMLYLASVAAYVLPAMRWIENPLVGALAQAIVLLGISVVGFLRRSEGIVLLAFHLGYLLGIFMAWEGLREGALIAAGLLFVAGALLSRLSIFRHLVWVIIPGSFLVALAFPLLALVRVVEIPLGLPMQVYLNGVMAGTVVLYLIGGLGTGLRSRLLFSIGSSLALLATGWFFREFYPDTLEWASFVLGCTLLAGSLAGWALRGCGFLAQLLFTKASFLIAVWAILHFAGDLRWMVLAIQTVVVALSTRRARVVALEVVTWAVAIASIYYFVPVFLTNPVFGTVLWWLMALYPAVLVLGLALVLPAFPMGTFDYKEADRRLVYAALPFVAVWLWFRLFAVTEAGTVGAPAPFLAVVYGMAVVSLIPWIARWVVLLTSALAFVVASVLFCSEPFSLILLALLLIPAAGAVFWLTRSDALWTNLAENAVYVLGLVPLVLWILQATGDWPGKVALMPLLAIGISGLGALPRLRHAGAWAFLPLAVLFISEGTRGANMGWMLLAVVIGLAWLALPAFVSRIREGIGWARRFSLWAIIGCGLLWIHPAGFSANNESWLAWQCVFFATAAVLLAGSRFLMVPGYFIGAILFGATGILRHSESMLGEAVAYAPWVSEALGSAAALYALILVWFFLRPAPWQLKTQKAQAQLGSVFSAVAALLFFLNSALTFHYHELGWMDWYTPILALSAFLLILLGLFFRDAVFRKLGLLALAVPLVRLFLVDVQDALHRIIAFAAAAVVLTVLGYLYHRLSSRLGGDEVP